MFRIVVTGQIASGKSLVANFFAQQGYPLIDYDTLAREVVAPDSPGLNLIRKQWGRSVVNANGHLDRATLALIVFSDATQLAKLNQITHPLISLKAHELEMQYQKDGYEFVVHDIPLLRGSWMESRADYTLLVTASEAVRRARMQTMRNMKDIDIDRRISSQVSEEELRKISHAVIENNGSLPQLEQQLKRVLPRIKAAAKLKVSPLILP